MGMIKKIFGIAEPKPGTGKQLAREARAEAARIETHHRHSANSKGVARGLRKLANDIKDTPK
jgi:hypothetical protein